MNPLETAAATIIKEQALVIGPLAWSEAAKVTGLQIDMTKGEVRISSSDPRLTVDGLVAQYERLFGRASHELCREVVASLVAQMSASDVPVSLRA